MCADNAYDAVSALIERFGLSKDFVIDLLREDDWSYVLKAHALTEAAITHAIVTHVNNDNMVKALEEIPMRCRLEIAKSLGLVSDRTIIGVSRLSKLRNKLAHRVSEVGFTFKAYLSDQDKRNEFVSIYAANVTGSVHIAGQRIDKKTFLRENPKWAINECLFELMLDVYVAESKARWDSTRLRLTEKLLEWAEPENAGCPTSAET